VTGKTETNATIWLSTQSKTMRPIIQQFLYKMIHGTHLVRKYWRNINRYEDREICMTCNETELMSHILTQCKEKNAQVIWHLAKNLWPHRNTPWPEISLGMILGCGSILLHPNRPQRNDQQQGKATL